MDTIEKVFLHGKPTRILVGLKRGNKAKYASILAREANCTYSHTVKILNLLRKYELIEFEKKGRKKLIRLTVSGADLAQELERILWRLEKLETPEKE